MRIPISMALLGLAVGACSGGSGGGPSAPILTSTAVTFTPHAAPAANAVAVVMRDHTEDTATFDVIVREPATPVAAAALELRFDPAVTSFAGGSGGSYLKGDTVARFAPASAAGTVVAVFARRDPAQGDTGTGALGSFTLQLQPGSSTTAVEVNGAVSTLVGAGLAPVSGEAFAGGTLQVVRN